MAEGRQEGISVRTGRRGAKEKNCFILKSFTISPYSLELPNHGGREKWCGLAKPDSACWSSSSWNKIKIWKKYHPERDLTKNCISKNETEPQHNWRGQTRTKIRSLPTAHGGGASFSWEYFICFQLAWLLLKTQFPPFRIFLQKLLLATLQMIHI